MTAALVLESSSHLRDSRSLNSVYFLGVLIICYCPPGKPRAGSRTGTFDHSQVSQLNWSG